MYPNYYLMTSSSLFILPAIYGIYKGHIILPFLSFLCTSRSIDYWTTRPSHPYTLLMDDTICKTTGSLYLLYGYFTIKPVDMRILFWSDLCIMLFIYQISCNLRNSRYKNLWIPAHMLFHYIYTMNQFLVL